MSLSFIIIGTAPTLSQLLDQLLPIGPCAYSRLITYTQQDTAGFIENNNWVMWLLSTVHVHTTKHCIFYRGQQLSPVPHKAGHAAISTFIAYIKVYVETFALYTSTSGMKYHYLYVLCRAKRNKHQSNTHRAVITQ